MLRAKEIVSASVNGSTEVKRSSVQINLEANNQSAHTLPENGLKSLVRPYNNWQGNVLLQFYKSFCVIYSGKVAHLSDTWHCGHNTVTGMAPSDIKTSQPLKNINVKAI